MFTYESRIGYAQSGATYGGYGQYAARRTLPDALAERLALPTVKLQFLITLTVGMWLRNGVPAWIGLSEPIRSQVFGAYKFASSVKPFAVYKNQGRQTLDYYDHTTSGWSIHPLEFFQPGQWTYLEGYIYAFPTTASGIFRDTYQAEMRYYCSKHKTTIRDRYWEPRVNGIPNLSLRIEPRFGGVGQIGGGKITLNNADGFFDSLDSDQYQWDAGLAVLELGADLSDGAMSEADFQKIGTWRIESVVRSDSEFSINLRELKTKLENKIPYDLYTRAEFPNIVQDWEGRPIPFAWGRHFSVEPCPIDKSARKFKVAVHPIRSFDGVRVKQDDDSWQEVNFATRNTTLAEFTLSGSDWDGTQEVAVDFSGRILPDGRLMENCADIMADLLNYVGETEFDQESFSYSGLSLHVGFNKDGDEVSILAPAIYLNEQVPAIDVAGQLNEIAGSFLFVDFAGKWRYGVFDAVQAKALDPMSGGLIKKFSDTEIIDGSWKKTVDHEDIFAKVNVKFAERHQEAWTETVKREREPHQLLHNLPFLFTEEREVALSKRDDADYWAQRLLTTEAEPLTTYNFEVPWQGFFLLPGDKVRVQYSRGNFDGVLELLSVNYDLVNGRVKFVAGNQRGWGDTFGFWVGDIVEGEEPGPPVFPENGLQLHLRSEFAIPIDDPQFNPPVSIILDISGNDRHAEQPNPANQPTLRLNAINGHPSVKFSGDTAMGTPPIAYWRLDDDGPPALDALGARNLTPSGGGTIRWGSLGAFGDPQKGVTHNGEAIGGLQRADDSTLRLTGTDFTLRGWIKSPRFNDSSVNALGVALFNKIGPARGYALEVIRSGASWLPQFRVVNGATNTLNSSQAVNGNEWYHIAATFEASTTTMRLYVNAVLVGTLAGVGAVVGGAEALLLSYTNAPGSPVGGAHYVLQADEFAIWTVRLNDAEILADFSPPKTYPNKLPQYFNLPNFLTAFTEGEIFAVVKADNDPGSATGENSALWKFGSATPEKYPNSDGVIHEQFGTDAVKVTANPTPALTGWRLYNVSSKAGEFKVRVDNTEIFTTGTNTVAWTSAPTIGTTPTWFNGEVAAVIAYNRVLTAAERDDIVKILSTEYNLGLSFPSATGLNVTPPPDWDKNWTDAQVTAARQNSGYWSEQNTEYDGAEETEMAHQEDSRSHRAGRWW